MPTPHTRPARVDDATVLAVGKLSEALEWLERARGRLYDFHQMMGHVDFQMGDAADMLRHAGHGDHATLIEQEVVGRNVLDGRWTFQIIEEFEDLYYDAVRDVEHRIRDALVDGRRHIAEAELKARRRSLGQPGHEALPRSAYDSRVATNVNADEPGTSERAGGRADIG